MHLHAWANTFGRLEGYRSSRINKGWSCFLLDLFSTSWCSSIFFSRSLLPSTQAPVFTFHFIRLYAGGKTQPYGPASHGLEDSDIGRGGKGRLRTLNGAYGLSLVYCTGHSRAPELDNGRWTSGNGILGTGHKIWIAGFGIWN